MPSRWPVLSPVEGADLSGSTSNRQAGFSLVELLITALILTVVLFAIYLMYETNMTTATWGNKKAELQQNARVALDMMEREIRMAGYNPSSTTGTDANAIQCITLPSTDCSPTVLTFIADIDGDNVTDKVQYTFNSGPQTICRKLWRWTGTAWNLITTVSEPLCLNAQAEVVADGVSSVAPSHANCDGTIAPSTTTAPFTYCDGTNKSTTAPGSVRKITISIIASGQAGRKIQTFTFASDVRLRNLP